MPAAHTDTGTSSCPLQLPSLHPHHLLNRLHPFLFTGSSWIAISTISSATLSTITGTIFSSILSTVLSTVLSASPC